MQQPLPAANVPPAILPPAPGPRLRLVVLLVVLSPLAGCGDGLSGSIVLSGQTMGTTYSVKFVGPLPDALTVEELQAQVDGLLERINQQMSTYLPESEISRFNLAPAGEWFEVSPGFAEVTAAALKVSEDTDGALDITVGPLVRLWRFGPPSAGSEEEGDKNPDAEAPSPNATQATESPRLVPTDNDVEAALALVGYEAIEVRQDPPALRKSAPNVEIDLSSIAKGYAVDEVAALLSDLGITRMMVEIGGEVRAQGKRPDGRPWQIGIERAVVGSRELAAAIGIEDAALATSGDYRNFFEEEGRRYSHIIDPRTGRPVQHDLTSVSIVTETCMRADALATAMLVLGPQEGYDWSDEHDVAALFVSRTSEGLAERETQAWRERFP